MEDDQKKWNQSTKINLIGCDTIVNSPSFCLLCRSGHPLLRQYQFQLQLYAKNYYTTWT